VHSEPLWRADWGYKQWIPYLLDILLEGGSVTNDMVLHYLLDSKNSSGLYHRIDPQLPRAIALDDVGSLGVSVATCNSTVCKVITDIMKPPPIHVHASVGAARFREDCRSKGHAALRGRELLRPGPASRQLREQLTGQRVHLSRSLARLRHCRRERNCSKDLKVPFADGRAIDQHVLTPLKDEKSLKLLRERLECQNTASGSQL